MLGANDAAQNVSQSDTYNALYNIFGKLITENQKIKVFISTILEPFATGVSGATATNNAIKSLVNNMSAQIYLVDMGVYSKCVSGTPFVDGHLTALGYRQLACEFYNYIGYIMESNLSDFKDVQFSNTDMQVWHD